MGKVLARGGVLAVSLLAAAACATIEEPMPSAPRYVQFTPEATKGVLYRPEGPPSPVAFLVIHRTSNFLSHPVALEMPKRGFTVLAMNPRFDNNEALVTFEDIALDIRQGVEYLRSLPGIETVILAGHSGGGPSTSYYQAVAESGVFYCQGANKLTECDERVAGLPQADGIVFLDAHPGNGINVLRSLNPAVFDEARPYEVEPSLDPFSPANGFNPDGDSTYAPDFQRRYFAAQSARMNRLIARAEAMQAEMESGARRPSDDEAFTIYRVRGRLSDISTMVANSTFAPQKFLRNDGTVDASNIVRTVRVSTPRNREIDASFAGALQRTVRSFLSAGAIRSADSDEGIDWCSSNNSTLCAVERISVPVLVMAMQGHYFIRDGEMIYEHAASADKDFVVVEGALHGLDTCGPCAAATGLDYTNARRNIFDYVAAWTRARF